MRSTAGGAPSPAIPRARRRPWASGPIEARRKRGRRCREVETAPDPQTARVGPGLRPGDDRPARHPGSAALRWRRRRRGLAPSPGFGHLPVVGTPNENEPSEALATTSRRRPLTAAPVTQATRIPYEIELKLAVGEKDLETLLASELLRSRARAPLETVPLHAVYYDTSDHRLRRRRLALRVRSVAGRFVQTLKAPADLNGAHLGRPEWEVPRDDLTPDLRAFQDPAVLDLTGLVLPDELRPAFETRVRRRKLSLAWGEGIEPPTLIEIAADTGRLVAGDRQARISELELELLAGDPSALYALTEQLRRLVPMRIEPQDKAARGWALATGGPPGWRKAGDVDLEPTMTAEAGLQAILGSCLGHWLANEAAARDGRDPEGLHQLRVALRRFRSALALFAPAMAKAVRQRWNAELRWLVNGLGPARDLDVLATETLPTTHLIDDGDRDRLARIVAARRRAAQEDLVDLLASRRYADLALGLSVWVAGRGWRQDADVDAMLRQRAPLRGHAAKLLAKRHRRALALGRDFAELDADGRHEVRIALKKLRYGTEFFGPLFADKAVSRYRKASARLQDVLGRMNDVTVAARLLRDLVATAERPAEAALAAGQVIGWHASAATSVEPELQVDWDAFAAIDPFWTAKEAAAS